MMMVRKNKRVAVFSTLNPYPFWAGSENFWHDFVMDERISSRLDFDLVLADSPIIRAKAELLKKKVTNVHFYKHFNVDFTRRNLYRLKDRIQKRDTRTLPWFDQIRKDRYDLVWFNVAGLGDLKDLYYPVRICQELQIPYWLILQHGTENFFLTSETAIEMVTEVVVSAKRFVFIAHKNRHSLERAIGRRLENAFHSVNALPATRIDLGKTICENSRVEIAGPARFFNLGRFSPGDKAQHLLLEAFSKVSWKDEDWAMNFIGVDGFGKFYLKKLIDFYGLDDKKINILSHTERVFDAIAENDVLLMPSLEEGTPFAMIEAMACGRPALGTPIGGIPELIVQNQTGWLAEATDIVAITKKMEQVWAERTIWREFGQSAQKYIEENYNQEKSFAELLQVLLTDL